MHRRIATLRLVVKTNLDDCDLEERIVDFLVPGALQDSLIEEGERIVLMQTDVTIAGPE